VIHRPGRNEGVDQNVHGEAIDVRTHGRLPMLVLPLWRPYAQAVTAGIREITDFLVASTGGRGSASLGLPLGVREHRRDLMNVELRYAKHGEAGVLSELALRSKGHWGYDDAFLAACRSELQLVEEDLDRLLVRVAVEAGTEVPLGFFAYRTGDDEPSELTMLFVEPSCIGQGVGRVLFGDATAEARRRGDIDFVIEAEPHALAFYERMGAHRIGEVPSGSIPGRTIPLYQLEL
jgi:GNAT superfamily N-acetyltransferase